MNFLKLLHSPNTVKMINGFNRLTFPRNQHLKIQIQTSNTFAIDAFKTISSRARRMVGVWLLTCSGLTFITVSVGGITRLTKSGLSMVDWHPFKEFPPLNLSQWVKEFQKYQNFPEFKVTNSNITLEDFKNIWYVEYMHRMLGRTIGAVFIVPAAYFWYKKWFTPLMRKRVLLFGGLLAFQGVLGWYMVKSGLDEKAVQNYAAPQVSHYRLTAHLGTAFVFYSLLLWSGLSHLIPPLPAPITPRFITFRKMAIGTTGLIFLTALSGALVAGLNAGLVYNSWPKMADRWIPTDLLAQSPKLRNFVENPTTVQFDHRILGELVFCTVTGLWLYSRKLPMNSRMRLSVNMMMAAVILQVTLGISTLLMYVPTKLAAGHQAGALTLLSSAIWVSHELKLVKYLPK